MYVCTVMVPFSGWFPVRTPYARMHVGHLGFCAKHFLMHSKWYSCLQKVSRIRRPKSFQTIQRPNMRASAIRVRAHARRIRKIMCRAFFEALQVAFVPAASGKIESDVRIIFRVSESRPPASVALEKAHMPAESFGGQIHE